MKTLSLKQPSSEFILEKKKTIELRSWNTNFRGEFFIHSSKNPDKESMKKFGFEDLPCGYIVGKANLKYVKEYNSQKEFLEDVNKHLGESFYGSYVGYGFVLDNIKRVEPFPAKGKLNFWNLDLK